MNGTLTSLMSGPFNVEESRETSELPCDSLNSTGFISDPTQKLVELTHLTESREKGTTEAVTWNRGYLRPSDFEFKGSCQLRAIRLVEQL